MMNSPFSHSRTRTELYRIHYHTGMQFFPEQQATIVSCTAIKTVVMSNAPIPYEKQRKGYSSINPPPLLRIQALTKNATHHDSNRRKRERYNPRNLDTGTLPSLLLPA